MLKRPRHLESLKRRRPAAGSWQTLVKSSRTESQPPRILLHRTHEGLVVKCAAGRESEGGARVEDVILGDRVVSVAHPEGAQGRVHDIVDAL